MGKVYTVVRRIMTTDPDMFDQQRTDSLNVVYESLAEANQRLITDADKAFEEIKHRKGSYKTIATAGKSKVAVVGFRKNGFNYETNFTIDDYKLIRKEPSN